MQVSNSFGLTAVLTIFVGFWLLITYMLAAGGWAVLAKFYPAKPDFTGESFWMRSARLGPMTRYSNCIFFGANHQGITMSVFFPFRFNHPPLFIPWSDISAGMSTGRFYTQVQLNIEKSPNTPILISQKLAESLARASRGNFNFESEN